MKNYTLLKQRALSLRKEGLSYREIERKLPVAKSTLSLWLKGVTLTEEQRKRLYTNQIAILSLGTPSQKERRKKEIADILIKAEKEVSNSMSPESYRFFGAALYWAEGNKKNGLAITNSDPYLILFMVKWFEKVLGVPADRLKAWLNIYPQQDDSEIKQFWSDLTGMPLGNFGKSFIKPLSKNYKKNNLYYGTIKVEVKKGTDMRYRILGWIKAILKNISPQIQSVEERWRSLRETQRPINLPNDAPIT